MDCYAFANHHRYLANHTMGHNNDDGNGDDVDGIGHGARVGGSKTLKM
jgi:hypothetical protein